MTGMLSGLRVLDFTIVTAGAGATQVLADFGAEVIKVESPTRADLYRGSIQRDQVAASDLDFPPFRVVNRGKRGLSVDLKSAEGREVARRLIAHCDVVTENFRRGAIERLGLGFKELIEINPRIVLVSISSQGATGPNRGLVSYGTTLDGLGGAMGMTGYDADTPTWSSGRLNYPDQTANIVAPSLLLAAVMAARADGQARWVDLSQREIVTSLMGEWILKTSVDGTVPVPMANAEPGHPGWLSRTQGEDRWVAITLDNAEDRETLAGLVDASATDDDSLRAATDVWAGGRTREEAVSELIAAGLNAAPVMSGEELLDDPYLAERAWWQTVRMPDDVSPGATEYQRGFVATFEQGGGQVRGGAPHLGEHTETILAEAGYSHDEIAELHSRGIVSSPQYAAAG